jgi:CRISPR-associated RAMP protein (TIGR02581 family)
MFKQWLCQIDVGLRIETQGPLLVKSGAASVIGADMAPVLVFRNGKPEPYIPGSSLKGVVRSHVERIARTLTPGSVCLPYVDKEDQLNHLPQVDAFLGCGHQLDQNRALKSADWYRYSCAACRTFGSTKVAGRFAIADAYSSPALAGKERPFAFETRDGVAIDRFTGGAARGKKFDFEAVAAGSVFETQIRLENFELWQVAVLHLILDDLADGVIRVGSGRSRGLGEIKADVTSFQVAYLDRPRTLEGLAELLAKTAAGKEEIGRYGLFTGQPETMDRQPELPTPTLRGVRNVFDLGAATWRDHTAPVVPTFAAFLESRDWHTEIARVSVPARGGRS